MPETRFYYPDMRYLLFSLLVALVLPTSRASAQAVLRNGDIFELRLSGMPDEYAREYSLQYTVGDNGEVSLAQLNTPIKAAGLSTTQLERTIEKRLMTEKIFTNPTAVVMLQPSSRFVTVGGAVRAPNSIAWNPDMTLSVAIKRAGGFSDFAKKNAIKISREGKTMIYDQKKYEKDPNRFGDQNPKLLPADEIEVPGD
jgi:protein involved in polysaccharide export with SLBB domain